jgi:tripartite ATP-independent transporter DctP family solute receptor
MAGTIPSIRNVLKNKGGIMLKDIHLTRRTMAGAAAVLLAAGLIGPAAAQTELKWAHEPYHTWAVWAAEEFEQRTDGRYKIEVFPASSLGKETDINEGLGLGTVDIIYTGQLFAGRSFGPVAIGGAPYMFRDYDHWAKFRDSDLFQELAEGYRDASGNHIVSMTYYGERHVTSSKRIEGPGDMAGLKIRVPDAPLYMMFPRATGANPTPIAFAEVYLALQQGVVDAQENPLPTIEAKKFYEVQDYIVLTGHITDALLTIVGGPTWDSMDEADRDILIDLLREAAENCTQDIIAKEQELVGWFRGQGKEVIEVDRKPFREAVIPAHTGPDATWDADTYERLQALK